MTPTVRKCVGFSFPKLQTTDSKGSVSTNKQSVVKVEVTWNGRFVYNLQCLHKDEVCGAMLEVKPPWTSSSGNLEHWKHASTRLTKRAFCFCEQIHSAGVTYMYINSSKIWSLVLQTAPTSL